MIYGLLEGVDWPLYRGGCSQGLPLSVLHLPPPGGNLYLIGSGSKTRASSSDCKTTTNGQGQLHIQTTQCSSSHSCTGAAHQHSEDGEIGPYRSRGGASAAPRPPKSWVLYTHRPASSISRFAYHCSLWACAPREVLGVGDPWSGADVKHSQTDLKTIKNLSSVPNKSYDQRRKWPDATSSMGSSSSNKRSFEGLVMTPQLHSTRSLSQQCSLKPNDKLLQWDSHGDHYS